MNHKNSNQSFEQLRQLIKEIGESVSIPQLLEIHCQNPSKHFQATSAVRRQWHALVQESACLAALSDHQDIFLESLKRNQVQLVPLDPECIDKTIHRHCHHPLNHQIQNPSPKFQKWLKKRDKINRKIAKVLAKQVYGEVKV